ncbi:MAG: hypothetical protein WBI40_07560 [Methylococcaceae bacterium]
MKYWLSLLVSIDQLFNTLIGGECDCTVSGHVAVMNWRKLERMIDFTFAPIEPNHCLNSLLSDNDYDTTQNYFLTCIVAAIGCAILFIPIRIFALWR